MSRIHVTVECYAGGDIPSAIHEITQLAWRLQIDVHADMNGVTVMASPGDDPQLLTAAWHKALLSDHKYKLASVPRDFVPAQGREKGAA